MRGNESREDVVGPENGPQTPFPLRVGGPIIKGFGRGSRELGIPTANIPLSGLSIDGHDHLESGVYYGWAGLERQREQAKDSKEATKIEFDVYPMVMSIGWNPFYKNEIRSVEAHIIHTFSKDFYGQHMNLVIMGYIRPECDYVSKESLIEDIKTDIEVAKKSLDRVEYKKYREDEYLVQYSDVRAGL